MGRAELLVIAYLSVFVNAVYCSSIIRRSALTLDLCNSLQASKEIVFDIVAQNDETRQATITGHGSGAHYEINIDGASLQQDSEYQFQSEQKSVKQVTLTSTSSHICVKALVIDTIIVVDQPTDFKTTCPTPSPDAISERPCKEFRDSIDVSNLFVCPAQMKDLLLKNNLVTVRPDSGQTDGEPPVYDIRNDMLQASSAIASGITEGAGTIIAARQKYREAKGANPLKKFGTFAASFETASSFISAIAPVFSIFSGITSIVTTFLTPNPFDELAKYLDEEFKQINNRLTDIQADIADLGRLIEAKGGILAMTEQLRAIRYTIRNYGILVEAMSTKPVCGARELSKMPEVEEFMRQYQQDGVDNCLLDLYGVEFGELAEAASVLKPYLMAYCHGKKHVVQKLAEEITYYGYAGLQSHFTYHSLVAATKGSKDVITTEADNRDAWMTKLYKFAKKADAFREASLSKPGRALQLDLEDEILTKIEHDEINFMDWLKNRMINTNDWPYQCFIKDADGAEENTLFIRYQKISRIDDLVIITAEEFLTNKPYSGYHGLSASFALRETYLRVPNKVRLKGHPQRPGQGCQGPGKDNVIFVSYCPNPASCRVNKKVFVSWKKLGICFYEEGVSSLGTFKNCEGNQSGTCLYGSENMLNTADRF